MDNHVQTRTWTLMQLVGTELGRDFAINKYDLFYIFHHSIVTQFRTI